MMFIYTINIRTEYLASHITPGKNPVALNQSEGAERLVHPIQPINLEKLHSHLSGLSVEECRLVEKENLVEDMPILRTAK
jgi:hypothetical protein